MQSCGQTSAGASPPQIAAPPLSDTTYSEAVKAYFLKEFSDVLVKKEDLRNTLLKPMSDPPMPIHLKEDAQLLAIYTPRLILLAYQDPVKSQLDSMVAQDVIAPACDDPSSWCQSIVIVAKANGSV